VSEHIFDKEKWQSMSIFWQMGNIGSEVGRALRAKQKNQEDRMNSALYRGIDLFNATIEGFLLDNKSPRELLIAREQFAKSILTDDVDETLEKYFMEFAIAERLQR
jgi:hypothetical protein